MTSRDGKLVVLAGGTGDLGGRIANVLGRRGVAFRALVRPGTSPAKRSTLESSGATVVEIDYDDSAELRSACNDAGCVVSALNGLEPVMIGMQGKLLDAAVAAGQDASRREPQHGRGEAPTSRWTLPPRTTSRNMLRTSHSIPRHHAFYGSPARA